MSSALKMKFFCFLCSVFWLNIQKRVLNQISLTYHTSTSPMIKVKHSWNEINKEIIKKWVYCNYSWDHHNLFFTFRLKYSLSFFVLITQWIGIFRIFVIFHFWNVIPTNTNTEEIYVFHFFIRIKITFFLSNNKQ